jgi:serine/threonine kinase 38
MWLNRLASVRGGSRPASAPAPEVASTSAAAPPATAAPSPSSQAKAEAAKKYIENMYKERGKAEKDRLERRRSLDHTTEVRPLRLAQPLHAMRHAVAPWLTLLPALLPRQLTEEERSAALAELQRRETEYTRLRRQKLTVDDFEPLTIIGRGAFGEVRPSRAVFCPS